MDPQPRPPLRELRRAAGLTQEQLAERSGVGVRTIRRLERGEPVDPRLGTMNLIAEALDLAPEQRRRLLTGSDPAVEAQPAAEPRPQPAPADRDGLAEAAGQLAQVVSARWQREEEQQRLHDPFPLRVRWRAAPDRLIDFWDSIRKVREDDADPLDLAGTLDEVAAVHRRVPSGRLVVLGEAGAGKTVLAIRFVLEHARTRTAADPVAVVFGIGSWNPAAEPLRDWLIGRLLRDHPGLAARTPTGRTYAAALVEANRVLPVLDGFDELAPGLRAAALRALSATPMPLVLTSRPDQYADAVATGGVLTAAAGIELCDLAAAEVVTYLPRTTRPTSGTPWSPVLAALDDAAGGGLAATLRTPLMVALARTVYSDEPGADPASLMDGDRFPSAYAIEEHLLAAFTPAVYGRPGPVEAHWNARAATGWLGHLARHLHRRGSADLAWWQLAATLPLRVRVIVTTLVATLAAALVDGLVVLPFDVVGYGGPVAGLRAAALDGLLVGPVIGIPLGVVYLVLLARRPDGPAPGRFRLRLAGLPYRDAREVLRRGAAGVLGGAAVGIAFGPALIFTQAVLHGRAAGVTVADLVRYSLVDALFMGILFGVAAGLVFAAAAALDSPADLIAAPDPAGLLAMNRTTVLRQVAVLFPPFVGTIVGGGWLVRAALQPLLGPMEWSLGAGLTIGVVGGLSAGLAYVLAFTAWGQWIVFGRVWLPLTGRLPWRPMSFLDDAYRRGVLRQSGAVYQFRHTRLQQSLAAEGRRGDPQS
ncbi:helix-turn-helix domain-containing protein [Hamadaea tsunoensis]|uniref:helix-turn-helix domain-containing protein n=1 Tax=Hamadaea tsunoensis TaxID=53368 RepID=UPI000426E942|nr:helix-turn-helix transcriptional regulator [Hamadaea tsunoensis]